jgi:predicted permease
VLLATVGVQVLQSLAPPALPRLEHIRIDLRVLAYALSATVLAGLLFGAAPALQAAGTAPSEQLKEGARAVSDGVRGRRTRSVLAIVQLSMAVALLIGAGLLVRTISALNNVDAGFATRNVLVLGVELPRLKYDQSSRVIAFFQELTERVASMPGVESAGAGTSLLLSRLPQSATITIEGRRATDPTQQDIPVPYDAVTSGFFRTLQIPLIRGRMLSDADTERTAPVALANESFVRRFFPGEEPVGKRVTFGDPARPDHTWTTIVGVVGDTRRGGYDRPVWAEVYFPHNQAPDRRMFVFARTRGDPVELARAAQAQVWAIDRDQPVASVRTVAETISRSQANRRFVALLLGIFAAVALALAVVGVYGVVAYATTQRTQEIGIRMALGADRRAVLWMVLEGGMKLVAGGLAIGLLAAFAVTHVLSGLLFGVSPRDPVTFLVVLAGLGTVALLASLIPACRAIRVEPVAALKGN